MKIVTTNTRMGTMSLAMMLALVSCLTS